VRAELYWVYVEGARVAVMPRPRGGDYLEEEMRSLREQGVTVLVSLLTPAEVEELDLYDEERLCGEVGIRFLTFPIQDRCVPSDRMAVTDLLKALS